ncbi:PAS domain S-box protein [Reichenbachiella sp. MSK19-1]|uniref:PAS domain-containing sensor histidine kinase n=1 Tax=Reichenbachiella sp. MSK19-1 TaxID=1897631 RepID=UPI001315030D|nr:PAS domain S-box protein [Reichenbachiella sp. MSK19-1]
MDGLLFGSLLILLLAYFALLFFYIEEFEDILGALIPVLFAFVFYSIIQKQNAAKIEQNEERLRLAIDATRAGLWDLNFATGRLIISDAWFDIIGYHPSELRPLNQAKWKKLVHPEDYAAAHPLFVQHLKGLNELHEATLRIQHKNGNWLWFQSRGKVIAQDQSNRAVRMTGTLIDLSKQKELEISLKNQLAENQKLFKENAYQSSKIADNEEKYRVLYENSMDAIILIKGQEFIDCNNITCQFFKCDRDQFIGEAPYRFSPKTQPDGRLSTEEARKAIEKAEKGEAQIFDWQHQRPNGELFDVSVSLNALHINGIQYVQAVLRDITEKKRIEAELKNYRKNLENLVEQRTAELTQAMNDLQNTQAQLIQSEKMASLGILTAGVAHEINNPLNFIMGGYRGLEIYLNNTELHTDPDLKKLMGSIKIGADRAIKIVKGLNQFSRSKESFDEKCDLHAILENSLTLLTNELKDRVEIERNFNEQPLIILGNIGNLHQVFINIIHNASDAIADTGKIILNTRQEADQVIIECIDNGDGVSEEDLPQLTVPFFTTKEQGKGTGLGLSISYGFIQKHNGTLAFESKLHEGTKVTITLPYPSK